MLGTSILVLGLVACGQKAESGKRRILAISLTQDFSRQARHAKSE
jgi:hypothetical protein